MLAKDPVFPPLDGSVTIPEVIDFNATHNATFRYSPTAEMIAPAKLRKSPISNSGEVVALVALTDTVQYQALIIGMMKAGLVPFPISPRNTPAAVVQFLKASHCHRLITTRITLRPLVEGIIAELLDHDPQFSLEIEEIGAETALDPFKPYPPPPTRPSLDDIALYIHSSGSTGLPKTIPQTHRRLSHWSSFPNLREFRDMKPRVRIAAMHLPPFHALAIHIQVLDALFGVVSIGLYPPTATAPDLLPVMPTPDNILEHARRTKSSTMVTIPAFLQIWAQSKEAIDMLRSLVFVMYAGGSLAPKLGDLLIEAGVRLNSVYGGTEFGSPTPSFRRKGNEKEWAYLEFSSRAQVRWIAQGDGTYECQFLTNETHSLPVENLPDVKGYATSDLWERHPTKDYLWKIVGRIDDVVVHSCGEKTVPGPIEDIVLSSPHVMGAIVFGREHDQPGILIEPTPESQIDVASDQRLANFRNRIWNVIEEANKVVPAFSRIFKELILVASKEKPLPRTGKGTVMRKAALKLYHREIEHLYATIESCARGDAVVPPENWHVEAVRAWILEQGQDISAGKLSSREQDLFEQGFDSLSVTILRRRIVGALQSSNTADTLKAAELITPNIVYNHPTVNSLARFVSNLVENPGGPADLRSSKVDVEAMIEKYSLGLNKRLANTTTQRANHVVLLTGTTGNLGSQLLASLLRDDRVDRVYALNRPSKSHAMLDRHALRFEDKALDLKLLASGKLIFVEGDASQRLLGLSESIYEELRNSVTIVIHNAWRLDFNLSLPSFESNVRGTRNLIDFSHSSRHASALRFVFTSSVASAQSWDQTMGPFPEEVVYDAGVAVGNGYGESKYISERLLVESGLQGTSLRIGQISGGLPSGAWATTDWIPILVKSSLALGALPSTAGVVSWIPMNSVSQAILETTFSIDPPAVTLNLVHPRPVGWNSIITAIGHALRRRQLADESFPIIPFQQWFGSLEERARTATDGDLELIPAIKLLDFFRRGMASFNPILGAQNGQDTVESGGVTRFKTDRAEATSVTMRTLPSIGDEDAGRWVDYWEKLFSYNGTNTLAYFVSTDTRSTYNELGTISGTSLPQDVLVFFEAPIAPTNTYIQARKRFIDLFTPVLPQVADR
ncbi:putative aminoadipate reductase [Infundibulicybe gibba]|nr:putative aminoadipate reductase [Infundibulicybe gibba]